MTTRHLLLLINFLLCLGSSLPLSAQVQVITQRQITQLEHAKRPDDLWPRGDGHALIGEPGGPLSQKAYHEPGGSFTPSPGSFGVSIWVIDAQSRVVATSDTIPIEKIDEQYVFTSTKIPAIQDRTPYYQCVWSYVSAGHWQLKLIDVADPYRLEIVFRAVGPAGGPLETAIWDQSRLLLNRRWIAQPGAQPSRITLGDEGKGELRTVPTPTTSVESENGWAFARLLVDAAQGGATTLQLIDTKPQFASTLAYEQTVPQFGFELPDKRFEASLRAQVATLMMGYIGRQTGPGEPINYPLAWERDGAYSLMAMAKAGQLQTARELSTYFAENDFFGGFGAEGDAPGSATNALVEVAYLLNDPAYFEWLWPHVERKIAIIDEMMNAKTELYKEFVGPMVPALLHKGKRHQTICLPAQEGLIHGAMDIHFPVLYTTAVSYRGLVQAARLATTLGKTDRAADWNAKAAKLRAAWIPAFGQPKYDNERNFMISVWPSWIVNKDFKPFTDAIEARRSHEWANGAPKERPLWTYFTTSEAHQWLFLERPERTWETLEYFFANQCAPGLYTYWEGNGEENSFRQWENYRGWLKPRYITPHYWTASEMLHLQLDMLTHVDESKPDYTIVIGAGVPDSWLKQPITVKSFRTKAGVVSWTYSPGELKVTVGKAAKQYEVRPGLAFRNAQTKVTVRYE